MKGKNDWGMIVYLFNDNDLVTVNLPVKVSGMYPIYIKDRLIANVSSKENKWILQVATEFMSNDFLTQSEIIPYKVCTITSNFGNEKFKFVVVPKYDSTSQVFNIQNDYISLKLANSNDIWFHVQKFHGSHVLLKNPENLEIDEIPENVLFNCALLAKENSKASSSANIPVDYCLAKFVKKASGAKPGMVIYNNFKTIIVK